MSRISSSAVSRVADGGSALDPQVVAALLNRNARQDSLGQLTEREHEVLRLMAQGMTNTGIAKRLFLSERTVEAHVRRLLLKLDIADSEDANRRVARRPPPPRRDPCIYPRWEPRLATDLSRDGANTPGVVYRALSRRGGPCDKEQPGEIVREPEALPHAQVVAVGLSDQCHRPGRKR